ncbi:MAG: hypothetical protein C4532_15215 [Candidatus Abyssobacteria bacterium SURF_17]|uniref:L-2-amino-thiazoline-4-carboxylic acid hydrolase n=1 Tax=Candidatus Abyssobacteria bacterium SURF_17 TaxID=2093361 RepID=A0A419ET38_9BACT|nr:MAG: hypothetical protein C4532_15215 [Candidatus Abyssubacteria bacterium SURF_17]
MSNTNRERKEVKFGVAYKKAVEKLRRNVLSKPEFDPAVLFQWGLMMALGVLQMLKDVEERFGEEGQKICGEAMRKVGRDAARQMLDGADIPPGISQIELISQVATYANTVLWASLEDPWILSEDECGFDILWCPLQDSYLPFDCRVQRYFVQGILEYAREKAKMDAFNVAFESIIPAGAPTCKFRIWRKKPDEGDAWSTYTKKLEEKSLRKLRERHE